MDGQQNVPQQPEEPTWQFKPGETISPRTTDSTPATPGVSSDAAPAPTPPPTVTPQEDTPAPPQEAAPTPPAPPSAPLPPPEPQDEEPQSADVAYWQGEPNGSVSWTASEYVVHHKTPGWHLLLIAGALVCAVVIWFITKDLVSALVIIAAGAVLSYYGSRKPNQVQYHLDHEGLSIGQKHFLFSDFRSFSIVPEGAFSSIVLTPAKRFALLTTVYYDPTDEERIIEILGIYLPHEERGVDVLGSLMRRIRF